MMMNPQAAAVKPRVVSAETHDTLLLDDLFESYLAERGGCVVELIGEAGGGKSTALAHLAAQSYADRLLLLDDARAEDVAALPKDRIVVYATQHSFKRTSRTLTLAPWSMDDLIEYMLATQPTHCSSVVSRFENAADRAMLGGNPSLYCLVAQQMAKHEVLADIPAALRAAVAELCVNQRQLRLARRYAAAQQLRPFSRRENNTRKVARASKQLNLVLSVRGVQVLLTADLLFEQLQRKPKRLLALKGLPVNVITELGRLVGNDPESLARLQQLYDAAKANVSTIASVLFAASKGWRPTREKCILPNGHFPAAKWNSIKIFDANLQNSNLRNAKLRHANLAGANLQIAQLRGIVAEHANFAKVRATSADFGQASLSRADVSLGNFHGANFARADLSHVRGIGADFRKADLTGACLRGADLQGCCFFRAILQDADFREAILRRADFRGLDLRAVLLAGADLQNALLASCNLEGVEWPNVDLFGANLIDADLTGSKLVGANLQHTQLCSAGLAHVDWENADLSYADLRHATFHLGSSRSGLVGSSYPCHGSRTGFYTNDYDDQTYKPPELIRKANLRGANLRGAKVDGVDFYLVDLRDAKYTRKQEEHFRKCDAILEST